VKNNLNQGKSGEKLGSQKIATPINIAEAKLRNKSQVGGQRRGKVLT